jgi:hypothetical protein
LRTGDARLSDADLSQCFVRTASFCVKVSLDRDHGESASQFHFACWGSLGIARSITIFGVEITGIGCENGDYGSI